jgi:hypothetical protein
VPILSLFLVFFKSILSKSQVIKKPLTWRGLKIATKKTLRSGLDLSLHAVTRILLSALRRFKTLFGMGRVGATSLQRPEPSVLFQHKKMCAFTQRCIDTPRYINTHNFSLLYTFKMLKEQGRNSLKSEETYFVAATSISYAAKSRSHDMLNRPFSITLAQPVTKLTPVTCIRGVLPRV